MCVCVWGVTVGVAVRIDGGVIGCGTSVEVLMYNTWLDGRRALGLAQYLRDYLHYAVVPAVSGARV